MPERDPKTGRNLAVEARLAAGLCTVAALVCLPALKWWATAGWPRTAVAALAAVAAVLACSFYRFMAMGEFKRCLAFSSAGALAGLAVWALFRLL